MEGRMLDCTLTASSLNVEMPVGDVLEVLQPCMIGLSGIL